MHIEEFTDCIIDQQKKKSVLMSIVAYERAHYFGATMCRLCEGLHRLRGLVRLLSFILKISIDTAVMALQQIL